MRTALPFLFALLAAGCAPVTYGAPVVSDVPKGSTTRELPTAGRAAEIAQDDLTVTVTLTQRCALARFETTERTVTRERHNDAPALDVLAAVGGTFLLGSGVTGLVSPGTLNDVDPQLSRTEVRGVSYGLVAAGVALLAIPLVDYRRSHGPPETKVATITTQAGIAQDDHPCGPPPKGTQVFLRFPGGKDVYLGATDRDGRVTADLEAATGADVHLARGDRGAIHADEVDVGTVALDALYTRREAASWRKLAGSTCATSLAETDCAGEQRYVDTFPSGEHVLEARRRLEDGARRRRAEAERLAWARLDLGACQTPLRNETIDPCGPLEAFRRNFPESSHTAAVQTALLAGRAARARLEEEDAKAAEARAKEAERERLEAEAGFLAPTVVVPYTGGRRTIPAAPPTPLPPRRPAER